MSEYPTDCRYTTDHEWARLDEDNEMVVWIGITEYAQEQLGDVVMVELPEVGDSVEEGGECGAVESPKSVSDIFSPFDGRVVEVNKALEDSPELVNTSPYINGWIFKIEIGDMAHFEALMDAEAYDLLVDGLE